MVLKNAFILFVGWAMLTALAIAVAVVRIIKHSPYHISLIIAVLMFIVLIYVLILNKIDGHYFINSINDERLHHIAFKSQSKSFWFLFVSIWCLALVIEFFDPTMLHEYISLILAAIGTIALFIYMLCFVWQKFRVHD